MYIKVSSVCPCQIIIRYLLLLLPIIFVCHHLPSQLISKNKSNKISLLSRNSKIHYLVEIHIFYDIIRTYGKISNLIIQAIVESNIIIVIIFYTFIFYIFNFFFLYIFFNFISVYRNYDIQIL